MLKDLDKVARRHLQDSKRSGTSIDADIACNIIDVLFDQIAISVKSSNISPIVKATINGMLFSDKMDVRSGIKKFVRNMNQKDLETLLKKIQNSLDSRK